jgi:3D (Asp-Asp-Asp) domain-containing protein
VLKFLTLAALVVALSVPATADTHSQRSAVFTVTAYCLKGRTASGTYVSPGTIAVDPRVIRLGTPMTVSGYGKGRALDTGGAIKGYKADVWMSSCAAAMRWGRQQKRVWW